MNNTDIGFTGVTSRFDSSGGPVFPDPFLDVASLMLPKSIRKILDLCEAIWLKNPLYSSAAKRIVRYFITNIEVSEESGASPSNTLKSFFNDTFSINEKLMLLGDDFLAYGNSLSSIFLPFRRFLKCKSCGYQKLINQVKYRFADYKFTVHCPRCKKDREHSVIDRKSNEADKISLIRWPLQEIRIISHPISQARKYFWKIPDWLSHEIKSGNPFIVNSTPWEVIETIKRDELFGFNDEVVHHMREETLAGVNTKGWGISRVLSNFPQAYYLQLLKRFNEEFIQDFVVPFRVFSPPHSTPSDPVLQTLPMDEFSGKIQEMITRHRKSPSGYQVSPFPLQYQLIGGEAKDLATPELLDQAADELLNAIGIPAELYRGTLQLQAMPTALRLFEQTWPQLVSALNGFLTFATHVICTAQNWNKPKRIQLQPVTLADDLEFRSTLLSLASTNIISKETALAPWRINPEDEQLKVIKELRKAEDLQRQYQEDAVKRQELSDYMSGAQQQQQAVGPGGAPMGSPSGMGPTVGTTPMELMSQAQEIASQLVGIPYSDRRKELSGIKSTNPTLHALVTANMEQIRSDTASQAVSSLSQGA